MSYNCENCGKTFTAKNSLTYHTKNNACKKAEHQCKGCGKFYTSATNMYRHMRTVCKDNLQSNAIEVMDNKYDQIFGRLLQLENENKELRNELDNVKHTGSNNANMVNNGHINNGNVYNGDVNTMNITVNVVPFGKEDLSKIDKNEMLKVFRSGFNSALRLTETTHFNPKYPEYHNVYISNMKNKYAMTYDGNDWALVMKDELIDKIYDKKRDYIEENMDEFINSLLPSQMNALHRWINADDDHHYVQKIKNEMKLMLYNKRKMALNPQPPEVEDIDMDDELDIKVVKVSKHSNSPKNMVVTIKKKIARRNGRYRKAVVRRHR